eukprot:6185445-Pleurochrysis_carterae.AAC.1
MLAPSATRAETPEVSARDQHALQKQLGLRYGEDGEEQEERTRSKNQRARRHVMPGGRHPPKDQCLRNFKGREFPEDFKRRVYSGTFKSRAYPGKLTDRTALRLGSVRQRQQRASQTLQEGTAQDSRKRVRCARKSEDWTTEGTTRAGLRTHAQHKVSLPPLAHTLPPFLPLSLPPPVRLNFADFICFGFEHTSLREGGRKSARERESERARQGKSEKARERESGRARQGKNERARERESERARQGK